MMTTTMRALGLALFLAVSAATPAAAQETAKLEAKVEAKVEVKASAAPEKESPKAADKGQKPGKKNKKSKADKEREKGEAKADKAEARLDGPDSDDPKDAPAPSGSPAAGGEEFKAPEPALEMDQMRKWEGSFKTLATFAKGGMMPNGGEAKGTYNARLGLNGHAYVGDYKASGTGGDFEGHGVRMWDAVTKKWKSWWYDSWVPGHADLSLGELQPDGTFITESESEYKGQKFKMRITERWLDDNKVEQAFETDQGQGFTNVMTIAYTRKGKWREKAKPSEKNKKKGKREKDKEKEKEKDAPKTEDDGGEED